MDVTASRLALLAGAGSLVILLAAFGFQYIGELAPCKLCLWQRYPHGLAIVLAVLFVRVKHRLLLWLGGVASLSTAAIAAYHSGIEQKWWQGPDTCTSGSIDGLSTEQLMAQIMAAPIVRCDEIAWSFLSLSMASWNLIASLLLAALWFYAWQIWPRPDLSEPTHS
ncbi:MAG: disulfide bond formation protein B [Paracoccaceae bacterium]